MSSEQVKRPPIEIPNWNELLRYVSKQKKEFSNVTNDRFFFRHNFYVMEMRKNIKSV